MNYHNNEVKGEKETDKYKENKNEIIKALDKYEENIENNTKI